VGGCSFKSWANKYEQTIYYYELSFYQTKLCSSQFKGLYCHYIISLFGGPTNFSCLHSLKTVSLASMRLIVFCCNVVHTRMKSQLLMSALKHTIVKRVVAMAGPQESPLPTHGLLFRG